jgi:hypothetical protein
MMTDFSIPRFLQHIFPWQKARLVEQTAGEVARQCREGLWRRIAGRTSMMSASEIRGYVRARAVGFVGEEVGQTLARHQLSSGLGPQVTASALDQLIAMVIHDVLCEQTHSDVSTMAA